MKIAKIIIGGAQVLISFLFLLNMGSDIQLGFGLVLFFSGVKGILDGI